MADPQKQKPQTGNDERLRLARERFNMSVNAESEIRRLALEDLEFRKGRQWPERMIAERDADGRPCLVINRIPQFIRQITNDQRQNRPSIKVSPVDDRADVETAKIYQGLIRHIEYDSHADVAYDTAFEGAVTKGIGFFRIITAYETAGSFNQKILIKRIRNSFSVYMDPSSKEPDGSDMQYCFVFEDVSKNIYKSLYPNSEMASMDDWNSIGDRAHGWASEDSCRVAEYFYIEYEDVDLVLLSDGSVYKANEIPADLPPEIQLVGERKARVPVVKWCKINAVEVLEETTLPGEWVPVIPVFGDELDVNGERILEGVVRHAKDSQRMYNYWASSETETIALMPRAPFIVAEGQIEGYEASWKTANRKNHAFLPYKPKAIGGELVPPPQRNFGEPPVQAITNARLQAAEDLKATTGIYDAALGARSNESSGVAIQRRNIQAQTSNFHFIDNLTRSLRHAGRIIVNWIPHVYDTARAIRILGEDGQEEVVRINQEFQHKGKDVNYRMDVGRYDVTVSTGPSFETKRQEAAAAMLDLTKSYPALMQIIGDLMVKNMDFPSAEEMAERIRKTIPPGIADDKEKQQMPIPPQVQQQLQQMNQMIEQLTAVADEKSHEMEMKRMDLESKERIENAKIQKDLEIKMAEIDQLGGLEVLRAEIAQIEQRLALVGQFQPIDPNSNGPGPEQAEPINEQPTGELAPEMSPGGFQ